MKRGPREQEPLQSRKRARPPANTRRVPYRMPRRSPGIISDSSVAISDSLRASAPSLSELKRRRQPLWLWDRTPKGCETLNAAALKLFGATPGAVIRQQSLSEEVKRLRRPAPADAEYSWIFRLAGGVLHKDAASAARAVANGSNRPANLPSFRSSVLTDKRAIIVPNSRDMSTAVSQYGAISSYENLDSQWRVVVPWTQASRLQSDDRVLLPQQAASPIIEVLNSVPMARPNTEIVPSIRSLCDSLGEPVKRIWQPTTKHYALPRVFIELEHPENSEKTAIAIAQRKIQGRPLVTALNYAHELTQ